MRKLFNKISDYLTAITVAVVAGRLQTFAVLDHSRHQELIEDEALRLEEAGKPEQAEQLRRQARNIALEQPASLGQKLLADFEADTSADGIENDAADGAVLSSPTARPKIAAKSTRPKTKNS